MIRSKSGPAAVCRRLATAGLLALGLGQAAACAAPPAGPAAAREVASPEAAPACAALDEVACLEAALCTLRLSAGRTYVCTPAADRCERGFRQRPGRQEDCPSGCTYVPARCYCSPDVTCVCGGGPPALCVAAGSEHLESS